MSFIDVINETQCLIQTVIGDENNLPISSNDFYRFVVLEKDTSNKLSVFVNRLTQKCNTMPHAEIIYLNNFDDKEMLQSALSVSPNRKVYMAIIGLANEEDIMCDFLKQIHSQLDELHTLDGIIVPTVLKLNIFRLFDRETIRNGHLKSLSLKLSSTLNECFANINFFPNCNVIHYQLRDYSDIKQSACAEEIFYMNTKLSDDIFKPYQDPKHEKPSFSYFTKNDYPWITTTIQETYILELIILQFVKSCLEYNFSANFSDVLNMISNLSDPIRKLFLQKIGLTKVEMLSNEFESCKEYIPTETGFKEYDEKHTIKTETVVDESVGFLQKLLGKKATKEVKSENYKKPSLNSKTEALQDEYYQQIVNTVSVDNFYNMLFQHFNIIHSTLLTPGEISNLKTTLESLVDTIFNFDDQNFNFWKKVASFYKNGLTENFVKNKYSKLQATANNVMRTLDTQIISWTATAGASVRLTSINDMKIFLNEDINQVFEQIKDYLKEKSHSDIFKGELQKTFNEIDANAIGLGALPHIPLINPKYKDFTDFTTLSYKEAITSIYKKRCTYYVVFKSLKYMINFD